jgi:hypothetical protein
MFALLYSRSNNHNDCGESPCAQRLLCEWIDVGMRFLMVLSKAGSVPHVSQPPHRLGRLPQRTSAVVIRSLSLTSYRERRPSPELGTYARSERSALKKQHLIPVSRHWLNIGLVHADVVSGLRRN